MRVSLRAAGWLGPCGSGGKSTSLSEARGRGDKIDLGRGNWCAIKGKRFFRKMEAWSFEKCAKNRAAAVGEFERN